MNFMKTKNLFMIQNDKLITPAETDNALLGITRDSVIELATKEIGIDVQQRRIHRSELYLSDEIFLTGTAAHVTSVGELDNRKIGGGEIGKITKQIQDLYFSVLVGENSKYLDWCTKISMD